MVTTAGQPLPPPDIVGSGCGRSRRARLPIPQVVVVEGGVRAVDFADPGGRWDEPGCGRAGGPAWGSGWRCVAVFGLEPGRFDAGVGGSNAAVSDCVVTRC